MKTDEIQEKIERTRDEMASTLHAIERKLSPRQLMDQAVDTMKDFASDQTRVGAMVRDNPIPLALVGIGIGWLALSGIMGRREREDIYGEPIGETLESITPSGDGGGTAERMSGMAGRAREGVSQAADVTWRRASEWSRTARVQAYEAAGRTREAYHEHPITMGAFAMLLGAALGAIVPLTRVEMRRGAALGTRSGRAIEKAKEEVEQGVRAARETAKEELTGSPASGLTH